MHGTIEIGDAVLVKIGSDFKSVNYSTVNPLLAEAREKSIYYLKGAIDGE